MCFFTTRGSCSLQQKKKRLQRPFVKGSLAPPTSCWHEGAALCLSPVWKLTFQRRQWCRPQWKWSRRHRGFYVLLTCQLLMHRIITYNADSKARCIFFTWILFLIILSPTGCHYQADRFLVFFPLFYVFQVAHLHLILWCQFHHTAPSETQIKWIIDMLLTSYVSDKRLNDLYERIDVFWCIFCVKNRFGSRFLISNTGDVERHITKKRSILNFHASNTDSDQMSSNLKTNQSCAYLWHNETQTHH